jgi:uncharacterized protein YrrD
MKLRRATDLLGLPVIDIATGKELGTAIDILCDSRWQAQGIILETKSWFGPGRFIEWDDVLSFGEDAVTIKDEALVSVMPESEECCRLNEGDRAICRRPVLTVSGEQLGFVVDVYFSNKMDKRIIGYELTEGFLTDVTEGRKMLPLPEEAKLGEDVIIVPLLDNREAEHTIRKE